IYDGNDPDFNASSIYTPWVSDGGHYKGRLHFRIKPDSTGEIAPQIKNVVFGFKAVLTDRARQQQSGQVLIIEGLDQHSTGGSILAELSCSSSYDKLNDKKFEATVLQIVNVLDDGEQTVTNTPDGIWKFERRENFPVEVREDADGDGTYEKTRIRAWVKK